MEDEKYKKYNEVSNDEFELNKKKNGKYIEVMKYEIRFN